MYTVYIVTPSAEQNVRTDLCTPCKATNAQKATTMDAALEMPSPLQVFDNPHNDPNCFPKVDDFMQALQDPGEIPRPKKHGTKSGGGDTAVGNMAITTSSDTVIVYPKLMKLLTLVQRTLQAKYSHFGIPKHPTDCKKQLALACVRIRKNRHKASVPDEFQKYAHESSDTLFAINLDLGNGGFSIPHSACLDDWRSQKKKNVDSRNPNDACRVAAILLLPEFHESVAAREKRLCHAGPSIVSCVCILFVAADKFRDSSFIAQVPDKFSIDGHETIDPNDEDRIMLTGHDGAWLKASGNCTFVQSTGRLWHNGGPTQVVVVAKLRTFGTTAQFARNGLPSSTC